MSRGLLTARERAAARLVTGPLAHLYAGLVDWVVLLARWQWARARRRPFG
jgi:hypothetical protein